MRKSCCCNFSHYLPPSGCTSNRSVPYLHLSPTASLPITAFIESGDFDIADGQPFLHIGRGIPNFKDLTGSVDVTLKFKTYPSATTNTTVVRTVVATTEKFDLRGRGRQANVRIDSDAVGDKWRYGTLRLDVQPDGGR